MYDLGAELSKVRSGDLLEVASVAAGQALVELDELEIAAGTKRLPVAAVTGGVHRVKGVGRGRRGPVRFSAIVKVLIDPKDGAKDSRHWSYWLREADAYRSGELDDLGGRLRVPRCLQSWKRKGTCWLWLEDVVHERGAWTTQRLLLAAEHLGALAAWKPSRAVLPWLSRGFYRHGLSVRSSLEAFAREPGSWTHRSVRAVLPERVSERYLRLLERTPRWVERLEALPQALTHFDAFRPNLLRVRSAQGPSTVLLDWAFVGASGVGADLGSQLAGDAMWLYLDPSKLEKVRAQLAPAYVRGARRQGRAVSVRDAQQGLAAACALRFTFQLPFLLSVIADAPDTWKANRGPTTRPSTALKKNLTALFALAEATA